MLTRPLLAVLCLGVLTTALPANMSAQSDLERYEIPVALAYSVGGKKTFSPIAHAALLKFDPR